MSSGSQASRRRAPSPRVERRRSADRERILKVAAARFAEAGPSRVRLEEIADAADVARGTLYSHFDSKDALVLELMRPVLEDALREVERAERARTARERVSALLELYLGLWRRHPDALRLSHRMMSEGDVAAAAAELHVAFVRRVVGVLSKAGNAGLLRAGSPVLAAHTLAWVAVPLLELYVPQPGGDALFVEAVRGLLMREADHGARG